MRRAGASMRDCRSMSRRRCRARPRSSCASWAIKSKSFTTAIRISAPASSSGDWAIRRSRGMSRRAIRGATAKRPDTSSRSSWNWQVVADATASIVDANRPHHSAVLVLEQMTVIDQRADGVRISKVHAQPHARILKRPAVVVGHINGVAQEGLVDGHAVKAHQNELQLMDVESVQFAGAILDDPIFNIAMLDDDIRLDGSRIKGARLLPVDGKKKVGCAVGIVCIA